MVELCDSEVEEHEVHINNASVQSQTIQKPAGRWSNCWNSFVFIDGTDVDPKSRRVQCKHRKKATYRGYSANGTSNMNKHLKKCKPYIEFLKTNGEIPQFMQTRFRELLSRAIIRHGYTFSWVEHEGNREIHAYLNHEVQSITRNTAKANCIKLHKTLKCQLMKILRNVPGRICLTFDMWTSCQTEGYLCLTAHYVDAKWRLNSKVLNFIHIESPHTGYAMYSHIYALIRDWGIEHKNFSITLDNASSNDKMQDYLKDSLNCQDSLLCNGQFFHIRCAAHVLNLIVKEGIKIIEHSIEKIRKSVKYVKWSETRKQSFEAAVNNARITETKGLWLDVPTRWNSSFLMLDRALLYRRAFVELSRADNGYKHLPNPEEWEKIQKIRDVLEPFCDITELFSGSDYPTANLYFENVWRIALHLRELATCDDFDLRCMGMDMKDKFEKYWLKSDVYDVQEYNTLFAFALVLDPRYKLQCLKFCYEKLYKDQDVLIEVANVKFKLEKLFREYMPKGSNNSTEASSSTSNPRASKRPKFNLDDFDTQDSSDVEMKTKLDLYLDEPRLNRNAELNILEFWGKNESKYGELSNMARDILSVPLTTVASESTFSIGGRILNKWRSSYLPENVEVLVTTRSWLFGYEAMEEEVECFGTEVDWTTKTMV